MSMKIIEKAYTRSYQGISIWTITIGTCLEGVIDSLLCITWHFPFKKS